jgi:ABC-type polysaccharide/polyol phosphate export permease
MVDDLREVWRYRELLVQLVRRDLRVRYKGSRLGFLWSIAPPLLQVLCINFALRHATDFARGFSSYTAFVLVAMIPWSYFQTAIMDTSQSVLLMYGVIKKVYLPRELLVLSAAISNFVHFSLSWVVFFVYWWGVMRAPVLVTALWMPYLMVVQFMLILGIGFVAAALQIFYDDVRYLLTVLLGLGLFLLPIMYVVEQVKANPSGVLSGWRFDLYMLVPMVSLITGYRKALLEAPSAEALKGEPYLPLDVPNLLLCGLISFVVLVAGYAYFNHRKWQFTERP